GDQEPRPRPPHRVEHDPGEWLLKAEVRARPPEQSSYGVEQQDDAHRDTDRDRYVAQVVEHPGPDGSARHGSCGHRAAPAAARGPAPLLIASKDPSPPGCIGARCKRAIPNAPVTV